MPAIRFDRKRRKYFIDYRRHGKRLRKYIGHSRSVAKAALEAIEREMASQRFNLPLEEVILSLAIDKYLSYCETNNTGKWVERKRYILLNVFLPFVGDRKLSEINSRQIEEYKTHRISEVKDVSVNQDVQVLKGFFNKCIEWGYLAQNPGKFVRKFKAKEAKLPRYLNEEEIKILLEACSSRLYPIVLTLLETGMRVSELVNLRWEDVDFKRRNIKIESKKDWHTKSYRPRMIPVREKLLEIMKSLAKKGDYVFTNDDGGKFTNNLDRLWYKTIKKTPLKIVNLHTLRHTYASHLVMKGVPLVTVKELLGHADIKTTLIYSHLSPEHLKDAVEKLPY